MRRRSVWRRLGRAVAAFITDPRDQAYTATSTSSTPAAAPTPAPVCIAPTTVITPTSREEEAARLMAALRNALAHVQAVASTPAPSVATDRLIAQQHALVRREQFRVVMRNGRPA